MNPQENFGVRLDAEGAIVEIVRDPMGFTEGVSVGMPFARLAAPGSLAKALSFVVEIQKQGAVFDWEFAVVTGSHPRTFHFTGGKLGDEMLVVGALDGAVGMRYYEEMMRINNDQTNALRLAYRGMQRDSELYDEITRLNNELVGIQRELAKKNAELMQLNQEKNRFLGIAAHDLRNPLHAILILSDFLLEEAGEGEQQEFLQEIHNSSQFMARLVDELLDVAKIESGRLELDYTACDISEVVEASVKRNRVIAARKEIALDFVGEALPTALVDLAKIEQVLNNLIGNAIKFSVPGSRVEVRVAQAGEKIQIDVQDWGTGIPPEIQAKLFTAFGKGQTGTAGERSSGLGLVIVKRVIQVHGGDIRVESTLGVGTTFFVTLPFGPAEE